MNDKITYRDVVDAFASGRDLGGDVAALRLLFPVDQRDPFVGANPRTGQMEWIMPNTLIAQACHDAQRAAA